MIRIGLTGWSDHDLIQKRPKYRLEDYTSHFSFVEMDNSFYAIPSASSIQSWIHRTPDNFLFIPKAFAPMTLHKKWQEDYDSLDQVFELYLKSFQPMIQKGKIKAFLFQFPPFFDCRSDHVQYLRLLRQKMKDLPVAIEFRHFSWLDRDYQASTLAFLREYKFIHTVVDQPQTPENSVQKVLEATHPGLTLYRLHGRNYDGWLNYRSENWRETRTLHDYSPRELEGIKEDTLELAQQSQDVYVIFNNNSGGHAAKNAKDLEKLLDLGFQGTSDQQLSLF